MPNRLEVPEPLSILDVQSDQTICKEIVAHTVRAVKVKRCGTRWYIHNPAFGIQRHSRPVVCGAAGLPRLFRPSVVAELTRVWNGVKEPAKLAGPHAVGANISRRCRERLRIAPANNHKIFVNDSWAREVNGLCFSGVPPQVFAQIDAALLAKGCDWLSRRRVQRVQKVQDPNQNPAASAVSPIGKPPIRLGPFNSRIEFPLKLARGSVQRKYLLSGSDSVQHAVDDNGAGLQATFFLCIEAPRNRQLPHIGAIDLRQTGIMIVFGSASIGRPIVALRDNFGFRFALLSVC